MRRILLGSLGALLAVSVAAAEDRPAPPLGSADFAPSADHPVGWRGDGTGKFPGAEPPIRWGRVSATMKGLRTQAAKPAGVGAGDAKPLDMGHIGEWLVLGPFDSEAKNEKDLGSETTPGEADFKPDAGAKAGALEWKRATSEGPMLHLNRFFEDLKGKVVFAHAYLYSEKGGKVQAWQKASAARVFLNGKPAGAADLVPSRIILDLAPGWNRLLVKALAITNPDSNCPDGTAFFQMTFSGADPAEACDEDGILWSAMPPQVGRYSSAQPLVVGNRVIVNADPNFLMCYDKLTGKPIWIDYCGQYECVSAEDRAKAPELFKEIDPKAARLKEIAFDFKGTSAERREMFTLYEDLRKLLKQVDKDRFWGIAERQEAGVAGMTSCTDGRFVYTWFADGVVVCHSLDGKRKWMRLENEGGRDKYGHDCHGYQVSPFLAGDCFVVNMWDLIGFDRETGEVKWKLKEAGKLSGFQFLPNAAKPVASDGGLVYFVDIGLFIPGKGWFASPRATMDGGRIYVTGANEVAVSAYDLPDAPTAASKLKSRFVSCKAADTQPPIPTPGDWCGRTMLVANGLVHDGLIYTVTRVGLLRVIDAETLKPVYNAMLDNRTPQGAYPYPINSGICASPTLGGKYIFFAGNGNGETVILKPGRTFEVVARNRIERALPGDMNAYYFAHPVDDKFAHGESCVSSPVFDGNRIYVQAEGYLYCIGGK